MLRELCFRFLTENNKNISEEFYIETPSNGSSPQMQTQESQVGHCSTRTLQLSPRPKVFLPEKMFTGWAKHEF